MNLSRRNLQFSLRALLVGVTAVALWFSWAASQADRQARAVAELQRIDPKVEVHFQPRRPEVFWRFLGERFSKAAVTVSVRRQHVHSAVPLLRSLPYLRKVKLVVAFDSVGQRVAVADLDRECDVLRRQLWNVDVDRALTSQTGGLTILVTPDYWEAVPSVSSQPAASAEQKESRSNPRESP